MTPLVSVIIPTFNRPHYLPRAVDSALAGMPPGEVEVIVVPNGPDESWKESLLPYRDNPSVRVIPIAEANANIARNTGLAAARGEFVRFLDDDDYLYPESAALQCDLLKRSEADVISGTVELVDVRGNILGKWQQPDKDDFCVGVIGPWRACQPTAHLFRRASLVGVRWDPSVGLRQDVQWLFSLCMTREILWKRTHDVIGAWAQHRDARLSLATHGVMADWLRVPEPYKNRDIQTVAMLLHVHERLRDQRRLTEERRNAVSLGLWACVHSSFFWNPTYWKVVAKKALDIYPGSRPVQDIYNWPIIGRLSPVSIQWLMLPKRRLSCYIRYFRKKYLI